LPKTDGRTAAETPAELVNEGSSWQTRHSSFAMAAKADEKLTIRAVKINSDL